MFNNWNRFVCGWCEVIDGLIAIITFGTLVSGLSFRYSCKVVEQQCKKDARKNGRE